MVPAQIEAVPIIDAGCEGNGLATTANVCAGLFPQALFAITEIVPPVLPAVTDKLVEDAEPDHPPGKDQK